MLGSPSNFAQIGFEMAAEKLSKTQLLRLKKAEALTAAQIEIALRLVVESGTNHQDKHDPVFLAAVLQTLATNFASTFMTTAN